MEKRIGLIELRLPARRFLTTVALSCTIFLWLGASAKAQSGFVEYRVVVDNHQRPLPGAPPAGWFYNMIGGDRGMINAIDDPSGTGVAVFSKPAPSTYRGTLARLYGSWEFLGWWYALGRPLQQNYQFDAKAIFHEMIKPEYQGQLVGVDIQVSQLRSPAGRSDLAVVLELKGFEAGAEVTRATRSISGRVALTAGSFPKTFSMDVDPTSVGRVGLLTVILDHAMPEDSIDVDDVFLRVRMPAIAAEKEPLLYALAALLDNYDEISGMVQDRSNFPNGDYENVSATGKFAKLLACGIEAGLIDPAKGKAAITKMADTLLTKVPRGPGNLWPHFTKTGGTVRVPGTEWASGDTAYAILDLMVSLSMIGDPQNQLSACQSFLLSIDWKSLHRPNGGFAHGYAEDGSLLPGTWQGFGAETLGVMLASLAGGGPLGAMLPPPSDNGSGFILHAGYPLVPTGVDIWGNDWLLLRRAEVDRQLTWYRDSAHPNPQLAALHLFGLSAAESPEGWDADPGRIYHAYGMGGRGGDPDDGNHEVAVLHYSGMIASLTPSSLRMWESLKNMGLISPLSFVESMAVDPESGGIPTVNSLKGSWNLCLFAEGWALAQPSVSQAMRAAVDGIPRISAAYNKIFSGAGLQANWASFTTLPPSSSGYVFAAAAGHWIAADTTPNVPRLWISDGITTNALFRELQFDPAMLASAWTWPKEFTGIATLRINGVEHVFVSSSGGIFEVDTTARGNVLIPFWAWSWDTSYALRTDGNDKLLWRVRNYGGQSGYHYWSPAGGFQSLGWSQSSEDHNKVVEIATGKTFGWADSRGLIAAGAARPPLLLEVNAQMHRGSYSTDGGDAWTLIRDDSGEMLDITSPIKEFSGHLLAVTTNGQLFMGDVDTPFFKNLELPLSSPATEFFDEGTGLLIAGSHAGLYGAYLSQSKVTLHLQAGGAATTSTFGPAGTQATGYAAITVNAGNAPYGTAVFSFQQNGVVVAEAGVPPSPPTSAARFFVESRINARADLGGGTLSVLTGFAIVNPNNSIANLSLLLRDERGAPLAQGAIRLLPGEHIAKFLDQLEPDFSLPAGFVTNGRGTLETVSDQPVSVLALRLTLNQRGEVLLSTIPVADLAKPVPTGNWIYPQMADGGGYRTTMILMNTSGVTESGVVEYYDHRGAPLAVRLTSEGAANTGFNYAILPGGYLQLTTDGSPSSIHVGWARLRPDGSPAPVSAAIFGNTQNNVLVSEAGVPAVIATTHARIFVDMSAHHDTGFAIANPGTSSTRITVTAYQKDGTTPAGDGPNAIDLAPLAHDARFAWQLVNGLPQDFEGVLDISSPEPFAALTLRSLTNERGDFLMTTFPLADVNQLPSGPLVFPQIAMGGGYRTQIVLINPGNASATTTVSYFGNDGSLIAESKTATSTMEMNAAPVFSSTTAAHIGISRVPAHKAIDGITGLLQHINFRYLLPWAAARPR